jgi:serine/threonine protein phosphatase 1
MRILAIGDIHGCSKAFDTLLEAVQPAQDDLIITLGDYVDRGPDSHGVLDRMIALQSRHRVIALCGNHDLMMIQSRDADGEDPAWLAFGGLETLASYALTGKEGTLADVPESHWDFLEGLKYWYETETHFFVHARVHPEVPLSEQPDHELLWEKLVPDQPPHISDKTMICGHTSQKTGVPLDLGHAICIDTWVYGDGWLTCLEVETGKFWQANQEGELRTAWLDSHPKS